MSSGNRFEPSYQQNNNKYFHISLHAFIRYAPQSNWSLIIFDPRSCAHYEVRFVLMSSIFFYKIPQMQFNPKKKIKELARNWACGRTKEKICDFARSEIFTRQTIESVFSTLPDKFSSTYLRRFRSKFASCGNFQTIIFEINYTKLEIIALIKFDLNSFARTVSNLQPS